MKLTVMLIVAKTEMKNSLRLGVTIIIITITTTTTTTIIIIIIAIAANHKVKIKINYYLDVTRELKKLWNMRVTLMPIVIGMFCLQRLRKKTIGIENQRKN